MELWNGNTKLPVYCKLNERISTENAVKIILDEEFDVSMLCQMQPTCVDKNCVFVIDLEKLRDPKDISCDDMGSWRANGTRPSYILVDRKGFITTISQKKAEKGKFSERQYKLIKRYILLSQNSYRFAENYLSDARLVVVLRKHTP